MKRKKLELIVVCVMIGVFFTGCTPFYINKHTLRKYMEVRYDDEFEIVGASFETPELPVYTIGYSIKCKSKKVPDQIVTVEYYNKSKKVKDNYVPIKYNYKFNENIREDMNNLFEGYDYWVGESNPVSTISGGVSNIFDKDTSYEQYRDEVYGDLYAFVNMPKEKLTEEKKNEIINKILKADIDYNDIRIWFVDGDNYNIYDRDEQFMIRRKKLYYIYLEKIGGNDDFKWEN